MLRIHTDTELFFPDSGPPLLLTPFLGLPPEPAGDPNAGRFAEYLGAAHRLFELADRDSADIHVFPNVFDKVEQRAGFRQRLEVFLSRAAAAGKPAVVFAGGDSDEPLRYPEAWIFRPSIRRLLRADREFAAPAWSEDFVERYLGGNVRPRPSRAKPVVGFCGYAAPASGAPGHQLRWRALQVLQQSSLVSCNFLVRREFWNGALTARDRQRAQQLARREFVNNIVESDYVLCIRGAGNFSYRLYETLCCGRIPVFVNTDCVLPYENAIDWQRLCVWVEASEIPVIDRKVANYHEALSHNEFQQRQRACRPVWKEFLSPLGFHANLHRHFAS